MKKRFEVKFYPNEVRISFSVVEDIIFDQAECFENTLTLAQRCKYYYIAKPSGLKNLLKAERAWFLSEEESEA